MTPDCYSNRKQPNPTTAASGAGHELCNAERVNGISDTAANADGGGGPAVLGPSPIRGRRHHRLQVLPRGPFGLTVHRRAGPVLRATS